MQHVNSASWTDTVIKSSLGTVVTFLQHLPILGIVEKYHIKLSESKLILIHFQAFQIFLLNSITIIFCSHTYFFLNWYIVITYYSAF